MSELPFVDTAKTAVENTKQEAKGKLLDWLPRKTCEHCGSLCRADSQYVERQASIEPVWQCPDCSARYHREEDSPLSFDMWR